MKWPPQGVNDVSRETERSAVIFFAGVLQLSSQASTAGTASVTIITTSDETTQVTPDARYVPLGTWEKDVKTRRGQPKRGGRCLTPLMRPPSRARRLFVATRLLCRSKAAKLA